jgi:hypothetical protein
MLKKIVAGTIVSLSLVSSLIASDDLKINMETLASSLSDVQRGFLTNDRTFTQTSLNKFQKEVKDILGEKHHIMSLLPEKIRYKASIAINSAEMIDKSIKEIDTILADKNMRMINRQMKSQKEFLNIQEQCFRCHNLVRDWK